MLQPIRAARDWGNTSRTPPKKRKEQLNFQKGKKQTACTAISSTGTFLFHHRTMQLFNGPVGHWVGTL